jgi:tRNA pseudouridine38-40 synthase
MRAYRLAYDGRPFRGFQRQPDVRTVEGTLFDALDALEVTDGEKPTGYAAAGRTDAGVSARAQTVAFEAPTWLTPRALNGELPGAVRAWAAADVGAAFHATADADRRTYRYYLHAPEADDEAADTALSGVAGEHDFHNLTPDDEGTIRTLSTALDREGPFLVFEVSAAGFPRQLVRRLVTVVAEVTRGAAGPERVDRALAREPLPGPEGVEPAPPEPLVLWDVEYGVDFEVDREAAASARAVFADWYRAHLARATVADAIREGLAFEI